MGVIFDILKTIAITLGVIWITIGIFIFGLWVDYCIHPEKYAE